jgi:ComF family protein
MIDGVISSIVYKGIVKRLIYQFKFNPYISDLTTVLVDLFYEGLIQKEEFINLTEEKIIVPVPLHHSKLRKRGYNQAALLAQGLQKKLSSVTIWECLERIKPTHTQVGLSAEQRKENLKNAFAIKKTFQPKLRQLSQIILVDDIITSGATMLETAKMLKQAGVKEVWGITLAHGK